MPMTDDLSVDELQLLIEAIEGYGRALSLQSTLGPGLIALLQSKDEADFERLKKQLESSANAHRSEDRHKLDSCTIILGKLISMRRQRESQVADQLFEEAAQSAEPKSHSTEEEPKRPMSRPAKRRRQFDPQKKRKKQYARGKFTKGKQQGKKFFAGNACNGCDQCQRCPAICDCDRSVSFCSNCHTRRL